MDWLRPVQCAKAKQCAARRWRDHGMGVERGRCGNAAPAPGAAADAAREKGQRRAALDRAGACKWEPCRGSDHHWVGLLNACEGYHAGHHEDGQLAQHGTYWWQDATYMGICVLEGLGLVWDVKRKGKDEDTQSKSAAEGKSAAGAGACAAANANAAKKAA